MIWAFLIVLLTLVTIVAVPIISMSALMLTWSTAHRYMSTVFVLTIIMAFVYVWSMVVTRHRQQRWLKKKI